ncbi:MAG: D-alanine--D-alanine ligase family protein [Longimicrobiales bacterium]
MRLRIGLAYNQKPAEDSEPPSTGVRTESPPEVLSRPLGDVYAEWDEPATIDAVQAALSRAGSVIRLEATSDFPQALRAARPDIVFNIAEGLHGPNREGHVPAICEFLNIPYTASDPLTLGLALDKQRAKEVFLARGVRTPGFRVGDGEGEGEGMLPGSGPWIVKPRYEGSSKGISEASYCETRAAVRQRVAEVRALYAQDALIEEFLPGREFTVAIMGNGRAARALPVVEIRFDALPAGARPIFGYEAKWIWDSPVQPLEVYECPARMSTELEAAVLGEALAAHQALGCRDWSRVDVRLDADGAPHVLEVNPLPGILPDPRQNSCFPKAARAAGISYDELIVGVLHLALERYGISA